MDQLTLPVSLSDSAVFENFYSRGNEQSIKFLKNLTDEKKSLYTWDHIDDPRHQLFFKDKQYSKIRNMSEEKIINFYKWNAKNILEGNKYNG